MSEPLRTAVFVDGQNFHKNLRSFSFETDPARGPYSLDEKHFDWDLFFAEMIDHFDRLVGYPHRLLRVYWYNAATITPFNSRDKHAVRRAWEHCRRTAPELTSEQVVALAERWHDEERRSFDVKRREVYERIQRRTDFLEFKFVGQYSVQPFQVYKFEKSSDGDYTYWGTRIGEKGVDVGIATDMIAKMPYYDVAVLVSGDADFLPAVSYVKDHLKSVYQFSVAQGVPPRVHYLSPWLKSVVDVFGFFDERTLLEKFVIEDNVPPAIWAAIRRRIEELARTIHEPSGQVWLTGV